MNDFPSSQKDGVRIADLRAEIQLSHSSHPPFPIGIYYLGLCRTPGTGEAHRQWWDAYDPQPTHCLRSPRSQGQMLLPRGMFAIW